MNLEDVIDMLSGCRGLENFPIVVATAGKDYEIISIYQDEHGGTVYMDIVEKR